MRWIPCLFAALAFCAAVPGVANIVIPPTYEQLMAESTLVVIGTVTEVNRGDRNRHGWGSTASLSVHQVLKGEDRHALIVGTYHPVAELNPRCCEVGATYIMFLRGSARDGRPVSVWGAFGMVRIAGPLQPYRVLPSSEGRRRN